MLGARDFDLGWLDPHVSNMDTGNLKLETWNLKLETSVHMLAPMPPQSAAAIWPNLCHPMPPHLGPASQP